MKKIALIGTLLLLCSGCGRGWLPFRGAPCGSQCARALPAPLPLAQAGCSNCGPENSAMYGSYDDNVIQSGEYYGGEVLSNDYYPGVISNGVVVDNAPTMVPTTPAQ